MANEDLRPEVVLSADISNYEQNIRTAETATTGLLGSVTRLVEGIGKLNNAAGRNLQIIGGGTIAGIAAATTAAARLQSQMQQLEASSVMTGKSFQNTLNDVNAIRGGFAVSTNEAVGLITQLNKMGQGGRPVAKMAEEFIKLGAVTGESVPALTDSLVSLQRQMGTEGLRNTERYAATLANLSTQAGVSAVGIAEFANSIAPISQMAGMSTKEILGFSTAFNKAGQEGIGAATAYTRMVNDINRAAKFGGPELQAYANVLGISVEQMKQIPAGEAVTRIFDTISKQGPEAIKTLERFGLDGIRTYRSILAVSQRGNIREQMGIANQPADETMEKFADASAKALGGVNDQMQIFTNNLTRTGQAIGSAFLPPVEAMLKGLNSISGAVAGATEALGNIPGAGALGVGAAALGAGTLVRGAGGLMALAGLRMFTHSSMRAGMLSEAGNVVGRNQWAGDFAANMAVGDPRIGPTQRFLFNRGQQFQAWRKAQGLDDIRNTAKGPLARVSAGAGQGIHFLGYMARSALKPLSPDQFYDIPNRDQIAGGPGTFLDPKEIAKDSIKENRAQRWGRNRFQQAVSPLMDEETYKQSRAQGQSVGLAVKESMSAQRELERSTRDLTSEQMKYKNASTAARTEIGRYAKALGNAGVGAGVWGAGLAGEGVKGGLKWAGQHAGQIAMGMAPMAVMTGIGAYVSAWGDDRSKRKDLLTETENTSYLSEYESALGLASEATIKFADIVNQSRNEIIGGEPESSDLANRPLTQDDLNKAMSANYQYTVDAIKTAPLDQIEARAASYAAIAPDSVIGATKMDIAKRLGDVDEANEMWSRIVANGPAIEELYAASQGGRFQGAGWKSIVGMSSDDQFEGAKSRADAISSLVQASPEHLQGQNMMALAAEAIKGTHSRGITGSAHFGIPGIADAWSGNSGAWKADVDELASLLGATSVAEQKRLRKIWIRHQGGALNPTDGDELVARIFEDLAKEDSTMGVNVRRWIEQTGLDPSTVAAKDIKASLGRPFASWGSEGVVTNLQATAYGRQVMTEPPANLLPGMPYISGTNADGTLNETFAQLLESQRFRGGNEETRRNMYETMERALIAPDMPHLQQSAAYEQVQGMLEINRDDFRQTLKDFQEAKDQINEAADPTWMVLNMAEQQTRIQQSRELAFGSDSDRYRANQQALADARSRYASDPNALGAYDNILMSEEAVHQDVLSRHNLNRSIVRAGRDMNIQFGYQREDFDRQKEWSDHDFYLNRERAETDFNRSMRLNDEARNRQIERTWRDYTISRERSEYEFNLSRERQEESYQRQLGRTWRDFNIQRERGEYEFNLSRERQQDDFNLQRLRQEEDYNHQITLMAEQTARTIYNIYERVSVQRTLSGTNVVRNMEDQARRMAEQQDNLAKARQMGLSDDAIRMLGLHEAQGAQQLARLMTELTPELIRQLNSQTGTRTDLAREQMMDPSNPQYAEMQRQYDLSRSRGQEDFDRAMARGKEDFDRQRKQQYDDFLRGIADQRLEMDIQLRQSAEDFERMRNQQHADFMRSLDDQALEYQIQTDEQRFQFNQNMERQLTDYETAQARAEESMNISQERMRDSLNRSFEEITLGQAEMAAEALSYLDGTVKDQHEAALEDLGIIKKDAKTMGEAIYNVVLDIFDQFGINNVYFQERSTTSSGTNSGGSDQTRNQALATGGPVQGVSAHKKADDIPIWATAGEYMQPVDTVEHYGMDVMEAMRTKKVPKELFDGYALGGAIKSSPYTRDHLVPSLIAFGRYLQGEGFQVGEHPYFGGVHPTAHAPTSRGGLHYIGQALDINYDGYGQGAEMKAIDRIMPEVIRRGFGYIWRSANHYDHLHIDTNWRRQLNGVTTWWPGSGMGGGGFFSDIKKDSKSGFSYLGDVYDELRSHETFKEFEKLMQANKHIGDKYRKNGLARALAIRAYDDLFYGFGDEGNEPFTTPGGVERWRPLVLKALGMVNQPQNLADITLRRMNQESSGNPRAINLWDINAKNGVPSKGLMQVIDPTFRAYAMQGYDKDIWDPLSNVLASMRYALSRYGGLYKAYSRAGGYADGGLIGWHGEGAIFTGPRQIGVGERGPEMVLPLYGRGVEFLNALLKRNSTEYKDTFVKNNGVPEVSKQITYNSHYDNSTHFNGPITVQAQDPNEMQRQLEMKKRQAALMGRR